VHALDAPFPGGIIGEGAILPLDGTPAGLAITTRKTVLRERVDFDEFHSPLIRKAYYAGLRCGCSVPLISHGQVLGSINVGSLQEAAFTQSDAELLEQVAGPVAIAVENALNFQRGSRERDRFQLMLEVNNATTSHLDLRALLHATSESLKAVIPHDAAGMALYDPASDKLRVHVLDALPELRHAEEGFLMPLEGTPAGRAFTTRQPVVVPHLNVQEFPSPIIERAVAAGYKSSCNVPLIIQDRTLGALFIGSKTDSFTEADGQLFSQIAGQLAIAVENALNFQRATREGERAQTLLEVNNAIATNLQLDDLIHAISASLRGYFKHDFAGLALYDEETKQLVAHSLESRASSFR
jgi:formate hydrogenlyase transcriptional activator